MIRLSVDLHGYFCNRWPHLAITCNDVQIYRDSVIDKCTLDFDLAQNKNYAIKFIHHDKRFGENGVFDTNLEEGTDRKLQIVDIRLDDVSIGPKLRSELRFIAHPTLQQKNDADWMQNFSTIDKTDGWMAFNGYIDFVFTAPVYDWLIVAKYKIPQQNDHAYFSGFSDRWHYTEDLDLLAEICRLMNLDENSYNSSSKTRTS